MLWTNEYLNGLILRAEIEISKEIPCIIDRYSLNVNQGISDYLLPDFIHNIKRVFWKGQRLDPMSFSEIGDWTFTFDTSTFGPFAKIPYNNQTFDIDDIHGGTPSGRPTKYFYNKMGENAIRLNPAPNESVGTFSDLYTTGIPNAVIIEHYRIADGITWKIPEYIRRRTIKCYVLWKAFLREGDGQNLSAANYYKDRYQTQLKMAKSIMHNIYSPMVNTRQMIGYDYEQMLPARPVLPRNYGIVVGDEDD